MSNSEFNFAEWLAELGHGAANKRAGERIREVVAACEESGGKGRLVLTLEVVASKGIAEVRPTIKITKPDGKLLGGNYFATDEGDLVTEDPRQMKLPMKTLGSVPIKGGHS